MRLSRIFLWGLFGSMGLGIVSLFILPFVAFSSLNVELIAATSWITVAFMITGLMCGLGFERMRARPLMLFGVGCSFAAPVMWLALMEITGMQREPEPFLLMPAVFISAGAIFASFSALLFLMRLHSKWLAAIRVLAVSMCGLETVLLASWVWWGVSISNSVEWRVRNDIHESFARLSGTLAILLGFITVAMLLIAILPLFRERQIDERARRPFTFTCPRCAAEQQLRTEGDHCGGCGLQIVVTPA